MQTLKEKMMDAFKGKAMNRSIPTGVGLHEQLKIAVVQGASAALGSSGTITTSSGAVSSSTWGSVLIPPLASTTTTYSGYPSNLQVGGLRTVFNVPDDSKGLTKTVFPFKETTIFKCIHAGTYMIQNTWGYDKTKKKTEYDVTQQTLFLGDAEYDKESKLSYVQPSQVLAVTLDFMKSKENPTEEELNSIKHMQYALAFLEKDILNKTKDNG